MSEPGIVRLVSKVDWTVWDENQMVIEEAGHGATTVLREVAARLGLNVSISRAATNVIWVRLSWDGES